MSGNIFINYRRKDAEHVAGRLFDHLEQDFSHDRLFFDVDNIPPGEDFVAYLNKQVEACDVLLAVVGPNWQSQLDRQAYPAGKQTKDFVRIEIEAALRQGKKVIPVLVGGVEMPREEDLPETLQPFSRRNAVRLSHERFKADATGIANALKAALDDAEKLRAAAASKTEEHAAKQREQKEIAAWNAAKESADLEKLEDFLGEWPNSRHAPEARRLKRALTGVTRRRLLGGAGFVAIAGALIATAMMMQWGRGLLYPEDSSTRTFTDSEAVPQKTGVTEQWQAQGPDSPDTGAALYNLASLYGDQGRYAEAEPLFKRGIESMEKLSPNSPSLTQGLIGLAKVYRVQRRYDDAEPLLKRAVTISETAFGPEHPSVAKALFELASLYGDQGRYSEAEPLFKRGIELMDSSLGTDSPDLAQGLAGLAKVYRALGRYDEAEPLLKRRLLIMEKAGNPR